MSRDTEPIPLPAPQRRANREHRTDRVGGRRGPSAWRQRALRVVELPDLDTSDGICAVWLVTDTEDIVLHARSDSALYRQQFVLHEFAHMLLGHCEADDCLAQDVLLPNIPPYTQGRLLKRRDINCDTEVAAESLADRLAAGIRGSVFAETGYSKVFG